MRLLAASIAIIAAGCATSDRKSGVAAISPPKIKPHVSFKTAFISTNTQPFTGLTFSWLPCSPHVQGSYYIVYDRQSLDDPWAVFAVTTNTFIRVEPLYDGLHIFGVRRAIGTNETLILSPFATWSCEQ